MGFIRATVNKDIPSKDEIVDKYQETTIFM